MEAPADMAPRMPWRWDLVGKARLCVQRRTHSEMLSGSCTQDTPPCPHSHTHLETRYGITKSSAWDMPVFEVLGVWSTDELWRYSGAPDPFESPRVGQWLSCVTHDVGMEVQERGVVLLTKA